jgi:hypothetical protein
VGGASPCRWHTVPFKAEARSDQFQLLLDGRLIRSEEKFQASTTAQAMSEDQVIRMKPNSRVSQRQALVQARQILEEADELLTHCRTNIRSPIRDEQNEVPTRVSGPSVVGASASVQIQGPAYHEQQLDDLTAQILKSEAENTGRKWALGILRVRNVALQRCSLANYAQKEEYDERVWDAEPSCGGAVGI